MRGDIRNSAFAGRAKEYVWSTLADVFPGKITPTDVDASVERNWCFYYFEGKSQGATVTDGQRIYFTRQLLSMDEGRAVLVIGTHPPLERVDASTITDVLLAWRRRDRVVQKQMPNQPAIMRDVASLFVRDAETHGRLTPGTWAAECASPAVPAGDCPACGGLTAQQARLLPTQGSPDLFCGCPFTEDVA